MQPLCNSVMPALPAGKLCVTWWHNKNVILWLKMTCPTKLQADLFVGKEIPMPVVYKEVRLDHGYRMDLLVENKVVIEIKTVEALTDVHTAQILTYLKLGNFKLGLLINFHVSMLKNGIRRVIN